MAEPKSYRIVVIDNDTYALTDDAFIVELTPDEYGTVQSGEYSLLRELPENRKEWLE